MMTNESDVPPLYSLVVPVYKNSGSITALLEVVADLNQSLRGRLELVCVVDGSPDDCWAQLYRALPEQSFRSQLLLHSRNFGAFAAIRTGLDCASGEFFAVMAADLQEPPELIRTFFSELEAGLCDVALGRRESRDDPGLGALFSKVFWAIYRRFVIREMPPGGVDIFGCNKPVRDYLLQFSEANSSLVAQLFWVGFTRKSFAYGRRRRESGKSAWTFRKKVNYLLDSVFSFTDLPVKLLLFIGVLGVIVSTTVALGALIGKFSGMVTVSGYTALIITVSFFGASSILGLGIVGSYAHRTYENSKRRPLSIVMRHVGHPGKGV